MPDNPDIRLEPGAPRALSELVVHLNRPLRPDETIDESALRELFGHPEAQTMDPESFRELLVGLGLNSALAGKIKTLLKHPVELRWFLGPVAPLAWGIVMHSVWWQFLSEEIGRILSATDLAESEKNGGKFRSLCRLAVEWGIDPETYRQLLVAAGLTKSRASELKRVLECRTARDAFVDPKDSKTWNWALLESRQLGQSPEEQRTHQLTLLSRKLVSLVVRHMEQHEGADLKSAEFDILRILTDPGSFDLVHKHHGTLRLKLKPAPYRPQALPQKS